ncbi:MAG: hypothetical protein ACYTFW_00035 [Planctomycetota bacterium]
MRQFFFLILFCFILQSSAADAKVNLALHKSYTLSPKPNYLLCADSSDVVQLTDGRASGSNWRKKSTVGWRETKPVVEIIIDLGRRCAIDEVRIHTVGGGFARVEFPAFAAVLLSDNGREFKFAGLVTSKELANVRAFGYRGVPRTLSVGKINAAGQYVKLVIRPNQHYVFLDEIEVFGDSLSVAKRVKFRNNLEVFKTSEELLKRIDDYLQLDENIAAAIKSVKQNRSRLPGKLEEEILSELEIPTQKVALPTNKIYSTNELLNVRGQVGKARAQIYRSVYGKPFVCLPANPMEIVFEKDMFLNNEGPKDIKVQMWQNEYESAAFNVINCSDEVMTITVSISPLVSPAGKKVDSDRTFMVRKTVYVQASTLGSIADALVLQGGRPFILQPGELTQIWLTIFNPTLTAGNYKGRVAISAKTTKGKALPIESIPVDLEVHKNKFPENVALNTCNWAYYKIASMSEMAQDLRNHHINVYVVPAQDLPFLRFSSDPPGFIRKPNFANLDRDLQHRNYARTFLLGLNFTINKKDFGRFGKVKWMTPAWKATFSTWLRELVSYLKNRGVGYDKFLLYPFDESLCDEFYDLARLVKSIDPKIRIYANSFGKGPKEFMRFRDLIDVWCFQERYCVRHSRWFSTIKSFGKEIWAYECLRPMKAQMPYSYYRLIPWRAFRRGQSGAGFWIYYFGLDFKPSAAPWNDTLRPLGVSGVVYGTQANPVGRFTENIVPSRRWEAWREGVEDYQYLYELQQAINKIRTKDPGTANKAQEILDRQVNRVLNNQRDSDVVYDARKILSDTLAKLAPY